MVILQFCNIRWNYPGTDNKITYLKAYDIKTLNDLLNVYFNYFIEKNICIRKCKNCGKYFIPQDRTDEKYCDDISPQNPRKTCKEYGAKKTYRDEIKSRPLKNEHNKTSQVYRMRINRAKERNDEKGQYYIKKFNEYKEEYEKRKEMYQTGKLKEEDFIKWIISKKEEITNVSKRNRKK